MTSYRFSSPPCWRCFIVPMLTMYSFAPVSRCLFWCRLCFNWHDILPVFIVPLLTMFHSLYADNLFLLRLLHSAFLMSFVAPPVDDYFFCYIWRAITSNFIVTPVDDSSLSPCWQYCPLHKFHSAFVMSFIAHMLANILFIFTWHLIGLIVPTLDDWLLFYCPCCQCLSFASVS